jgi:hypothetical protein
MLIWMSPMVTSRALTFRYLAQLYE